MAVLGRHRQCSGQVKMPKLIESEMYKYISKQIIEHNNSACFGNFVSNISTCPKKDGSYRMILNLKPLNEFVDYHHDIFNTAVKPGCFMPSIDLKDCHP